MLSLEGAPITLVLMMRHFQYQRKLFCHFCVLVLCLKLYVFCIKRNKSEIMPGEIPYFALHISVARIWIFVNHKPIARLFHEFYGFYFQNFCCGKSIIMDSKKTERLWEVFLCLSPCVWSHVIKHVTFYTLYYLSILDLKQLFWNHWSSLLNSFLHISKILRF